MPPLLSDVTLSGEVVIASESSSECCSTENGRENELHDNFTCDESYSDFEPECFPWLWAIRPPQSLIRALTNCCECPSLMVFEMRRTFLMAAEVIFKK